MKEIIQYAGIVIISCIAGTAAMIIAVVMHAGEFTAGLVTGMASAVAYFILLKIVEE